MKIMNTKYQIRYVLVVLAGLALFAGMLSGVAQARPSADVIDGNARFTVLSPTLIRMEYAADGVFDNGTTFNVVNRNFSAPSYTTQIVGGWREIQTSNVLVRYQQNSGAFVASNLTAQLTVNGQTVVAQPFAGCVFAKLCEAEDAALSGSASIASDHVNYTGAGFVAGYNATGAKATWAVQSAPAGNATLTARYANSTGGDGQTVTRTLSLYVNGVKTQISLPTTANWDTWANYQRTVSLNAGTNTIALSCDTGDSCNINLDSLSLTTVGGGLPSPDVSTNLGGWRRGLDQISGAVPLQNGLLDRRGWYLLNDEKTVLWTPGGWPQQRSTHGGTYQDGYFFGYAHDYQLGLREFAQLTGPAPRLPRFAFGDWFSRYNAYTFSNYQSLLSTFRTEKVPLDVLVVDTDWKSPATWDGWNWNSSLFPDPAAFMTWANQNGLKVSLNVHPAIENNDPKFSAANATAGGLLGPAPSYHFDWSNSNHSQAYFDLHTPFNNQGVRIWWLDWCCDASLSSMAGLTQDSWINYQYAKNATDRGLRGFAFARIGAANAAYPTIGPSASGPWADHRYTVHFTGDTYDTWPLLQFAAKLTVREGNIGLPYVTHDIGSFHGGQEADDFYMRWIQFGTFQPIFRVHSDHAARLPWEYPNVKVSAENFWRLRNALVPYTYSLGHEATVNGLPIVRGLYLYYPENNEAYTYDSEYLFGSKMLVAPIVTAGSNASVSVWFPPSSTWTNYFTGQTYAGGTVQSISATYDTYPVFVKAGGIIPLAPYMDYVGQKAVDPLTVRIFTGADGDFTLIEDAGEGLGYQTGATSMTPFVYTNSSKTLQISAAQGTYPGALTQRAYDLEFNGVTASPTTVTVNGAALNQVAPGSGEGWWYTTGTSKLNVHLNARSTASAWTITYSGTAPTPTPNPNPTPVALYAFENNANDSSGNGNNGTATSVTYVAGHVGQAASFNGTSSYIQIPRSIQDNFTISFWIKTSSTGGTGTNWYNGKGLVDGEVANVVNDFGTSLISGKIAFGVGNPDTTLMSTGTINNNAWRKVTVTRNSSTGAMIVYVDGAQQATVTGPTGAKNAPPYLRIGSIQAGNNFFSGQLDEVRLYNVVLTAAQVAALP